MDRKQLLHSLVAMAAADGSFSESEIQFLSDRCASWGIDDEGFAETLQEVVKNPDQTTIEIPSSKEDCVELIQELVRMMGADGYLAEDEKHLFAAAASRMDISFKELDDIIDATLRGHSEVVSSKRINGSSSDHDRHARRISFL